MAAANNRPSLAISYPPTIASTQPSTRNNRKGDITVVCTFMITPNAHQVRPKRANTREVIDSVVPDSYDTANRTANVQKPTWAKAEVVPQKLNAGALVAMLYRGSRIEEKRVNVAVKKNTHISAKKYRPSSESTSKRSSCGKCAIKMYIAINIIMPTDQ